MPLTSNYIKVKSRRSLQRENRESMQVVNKAGSSFSMPGGNNMPIGVSVPEGVRMPNSFESKHAPSGGPLTGTVKHSWTPSAGTGQGSVNSPPEMARGQIVNPKWMPWVGSPRNFDLYSYKAQQVSTSRGQRYDQANQHVPGDVYRSGSIRNKHK